MKDLMWCIGGFILIYLFYLVFVMARKKMLLKMIDGKEMKYLKYRYKIKIDEKNIKGIANSVFLANSFILATTAYVVMIMKSFWLELLLGTVTITALIFICYSIIGRYYSNKQRRNKNV